MPATSTKKRPAAKPKNPFLAVGMSFAVPGAGQFYLGAPVRGAAYLAVALAIVGYICYTAFTAALDVDPEQIAQTVQAVVGRLSFAAGVLYPGVTIASMADAWLHAKRQG